MRKFFKKLKPKWIFFGIVSSLYIVLLFLNFSLFRDALEQFARLLRQVLPVFGIVFIFMVLSDLLFKTKKIIKFLGEKSGITGWIVVIIGGVLSMGPIYAWYPLLSDLKEKGMKDSLIATFLYNRAIKPALLPMMMYYFGLPFAIVLSFYMIIFSVINGILVGRFAKIK